MSWYQKVMFKKREEKVEKLEERERQEGERESNREEKIGKMETCRKDTESNLKVQPTAKAGHILAAKEQ